MRRFCERGSTLSAISTRRVAPYPVMKRSGEFSSSKKSNGLPTPRAWLIRSALPRRSTFTVKIERRGSAERISHARGVGSPFDFFDEENSPDRFMTGYGATRRVEMAESVDPRSQKRRILRYQRVAGLFEEYIALM